MLAGSHQTRHKHALDQATKLLLHFVNSVGYSQLPLLARPSWNAASSNVEDQCRFTTVLQLSYKFDPVRSSNNAGIGLAQAVTSASRQSNNHENSARWSVHVCQ